MKRCRLCAKQIAAERTDNVHPSCIKKMFGGRYFPSLALSSEDIPRDLPIGEGKLPVSWVQQKVPLILNRKTKKLEPAANKAESVFIMKPQSQKYKNLPLNEHTCMNIASHMGTSVPYHCLMPLKDAGRNSDKSPVYVVRRFDRVKDKTIKKKNFLEILDKTDPYSGDLLEIGEKVRKISEFPGLDVQLFLEMVLVSFILGRSDLHFKSFSILLDEEGNVRLSPAYDMISSKLVLQDRETEDFATPMLGKTSQIDGHDFMSFSNHLRIPEKAYLKIFLRFFKGKRIIGKLIKDSPLTMEEKLKFSDIINERFKRLLT